MPYETLKSFDPDSVTVGRMYDTTAMVMLFQRDRSLVQIRMPEQGRIAEGRPHTFRGVLYSKAEDRMYFRAPDRAPNQWTATVRYRDLVWMIESDQTKEVADL